MTDDETELARVEIDDGETVRIGTPDHTYITGTPGVYKLVRCDEGDSR